MDDNPYQGLPGGPDIEPAKQAGLGKSSGRSLRVAMVGVGIYAIATLLCLGGFTPPGQALLNVLPDPVWWLLLGGPVVLSLFGTVNGLAWMLRAWGKGIAENDWWTAATGVLASVSLFGVGAGFIFLSMLSFGRGRQLRRFGRILLPPVVPTDTWAKQQGLLTTIPDALRTSLAAAWRENGRTEHASVAAFARLTQDLMALGAPPALLLDAQQDATEEIRHTEACFALARAIDGQSQSPGAFPALRRAGSLLPGRTLALCQLAVDSLVDGALHEGLSARIVAQLAQRCEIPEVEAVLRQIAADEARHAQHGWAVVEWCLSEGGVAVAWALRGAIWKLPLRVASERPERAITGDWERFGIPGAALEAAEYAKIRALVVSRVERMVGSVLQPALL